MPFVKRYGDAKLSQNDSFKFLASMSSVVFSYCCCKQRRYWHLFQKNLNANFMSMCDEINLWNEKSMICSIWVSLKLVLSHYHLTHLLCLLVQVVQLMLLDCKRAVSLLIQNKDLITPSEVVTQLLNARDKCDSRYFLHLYLHALFEVNPHAGKDFHDMQVLKC